MTRRFRLALLGALYFAQGVPWGLVTVTLAWRWTKAGFGAAELAPLFVWATMPWTFKLFFGPLVDALGARAGRRRWMIVAAELTMAASLVALAAIDAAARPRAFLALVFVHNLFAAFQDVATDALAISILPEDERGTANGVMSASKFVGTLAGGPALMTVSGALGWPTAAAIAAALTLAPSVMVPFARETAGGVAPRAWLRELRTAFRPRATWLAIPFALTTGAADAFLQPIMFPLLHGPLALSDGQVSALVWTSGIAQALAAVAGGQAADRFGRRPTIVASSVALALVYAGFAGLRPAWPSMSFQLGYAVASGIASGVLYSSSTALLMDLTDLAVGATQFQFFMATYNVALTWAPKLGGAASRHLTTAPLFAVAAAIQLASLLALPRGARAAAAPDAQ